MGVVLGPSLHHHIPRTLYSIWPLISGSLPICWNENENDLRTKAKYVLWKFSTKLRNTIIYQLHPNDPIKNVHTSEKGRIKKKKKKKSGNLVGQSLSEFFFTKMNLYLGWGRGGEMAGPSLSHRRLPWLSCPPLPHPTTLQCWPVPCIVTPSIQSSECFSALVAHWESPGRWFLFWEILLNILQISPHWSPPLGSPPTRPSPHYYDARPLP